MANKSLFHRFVSRFRKNRILSNVLRRFGRPAEPDKWVFILGNYNSGTTLLEQILGRHPDVSTLNDEGVILTDQLYRPEDFGYNRIWFPVKDQLFIDPKNPDSVRRAEVVKKHWSFFFDRRKKVFVEKSVSNALRIDFFSTYFQPAYFIYIVRNGYAVAEGIRRKANPARFRNAVEQYPLDMCIRQWVESDKLISASLEGKRSIRIRYEDLTAEPAKVMQEICKFLGLSEIPADRLAASFTIHGKRQKIQNMNQKSIAALSTDEIKIIGEKAGELLNRYNYSV